MFSSLTNWFTQFFSMEDEPNRIQQGYQQAAEYLRQALECDEQSSRLFFQSLLDNRFLSI